MIDYLIDKISEGVTLEEAIGVIIWEGDIIIAEVNQDQEGWWKNY